MKVTMFDCTENPERKIATYAAVCYDASVEDDALDRRIARLMNLKHLATLRFAQAVFKIEGISRVCSHQLVRHPHLSYLQRSQRYCNEAESEVIYPPGLDDAGKALFDMGVAHTRTVYNLLLDKGMQKGDARFILPQAVETDVYVVGNFQAWYDFLVRRLDKKAQWEIRVVAESVLDSLVEVAPNIFGPLKNSTSQIDAG